MHPDNNNPTDTPQSPANSGQAAELSTESTTLVDSTDEADATAQDYWVAPEDEERPRHDHMEHGHSAGLPPAPRYQLPQDDPFWQFGTPIESWGSTRKAASRQTAARKSSAGPRPYIECRKCGVKVEQRAVRTGHRPGRVGCPMCGRWMVPGRV